jgi:hypothetical protein
MLILLVDTRSNASRCYEPFLANPDSRIFTSLKRIHHNASTLANRANLDVKAEYTERFRPGQMPLGLFGPADLDGLQGSEVPIAVVTIAGNPCD